MRSTRSQGISRRHGRKGSPVKTASTLLALLITGLSFGCGPSAKPAETPETDESKPTPEAWQGMLKTYGQQLTLCEKSAADTEVKLNEFLDKISGTGKDAMGQPLKPMSEVAAKLAEEKVTVTLENKGTPENPLFFVKDSFMEEGQKLAGAPPAKMQAFAKRAGVINPLTSALRDQVSASNAAIMTSWMGGANCTQYAQAFGTTLGAIKNGGHEPTPEVFELYAKFLKANLRNQTATSVTVGSVAVLIATLKSGKASDGKAIDGIVKAARETVAKPVDVTPQQAKQAYELAGADLTNACISTLEEQKKKHPEWKIGDPKDSCTGDGLKRNKPKAAPGGEEGGGLFDTILAIVPGGSMAKAAVEGVKALADGDAAGALRSAAAMVPPGTPMAAALQQAMPIVDAVAPKKG